MSGQGKLDTMRLHGGHVGHLVDEATHALRLDVTNQVVVLTPVNISIQVDAVVQETCIETHIELMFLLVGQLRIGNIAQHIDSLHLVGLRTPCIRRIVDRQGVRHVRRTTVGSQRIRQAECQVRNGIVALLHPLTEETFLVDIPSARDVPRGKPAGRTGLTQLIGTLVAERAIDDVAPLVRIATHKEVSQVTRP